MTTLLTCVLHQLHCMVRLAQSILTFPLVPKSDHAQLGSDMLLVIGYSFARWSKPI